MNNQTYRQVQHFVQNNREQILQELRELVEIQSGSYNIAGVNKAQEYLFNKCKELDLEVERVPAEEYGDHLLAREKQSKSDRPNIILDTHIDTVFPADSAPKFFVDQANNRATGQGVVDMKSGVIVALWTLKTLKELDLRDRPNLSLFVASDEEIGSPSSEDVIQRLAPTTDFCLTFEAAPSDLGVVTGRRGYMDIEIECTGRAGHSGNTLTDRRNAIEELCFQIVQLRALALEEKEQGFLFNPGLIQGGTAVNAIAEKAVCTCDIRYTDSKHCDHVLNKMREKLSSGLVPGVTTKLRLIPERRNPPLASSEKTIAVAEKFQAIIQSSTGQQVQQEFRGGGSNANIWSHHGVPALDGFGPYGADDHSDREWMQLDTLFARIPHVIMLLLEM